MWYADGSCFALAESEVLMMIWVLELAASKVGLAVIFVASCVVALIVNNAHQRSIGAEKVVAKIEKATNENVKKADAARRSVDRIPDSGLLDAYRRD